MRTTSRVAGYGPRTIFALLLCACPALLGGCYGLFTSSPVSSFQREPTALPLETRLTYAQDALATGNPELMRKAYDSLEGEPAAEAQYLSFQLGAEISGFPRFIRGLLDGTRFVHRGSLREFDDYLAGNAVDPGYLVAAAGHLRDAEASGATIQPLDCVAAACGAIFAEALQPDGTLNLSDPSSLDLAGATSFIDEALRMLVDRPPEDPERLFISTFGEYLDSIGAAPLHAGPARVILWERTPRGPSCNPLSMFTSTSFAAGTFR